MDQQHPNVMSQQIKQNRTTLIILTSILTTAILTGAGIYVYESHKYSLAAKDLQDQIDTLKHELADNQNTRSAIISAPSPATSTSPIPTTSPTTSTTNSIATHTTGCDSRISLSNLENAYFVTDPVKMATNTFKLTNGSYKSGSNVLTLLTEFVACDSITKNDVATIASQNVGGTGYSYFLQTFSPKGNNPTMTAMAYLGDRVGIKSLTMTSGIITVEMLTQGPNDSMAEPTQKTTVRYQLPTSGPNLIKL